MQVITLDFETEAIVGNPLVNPPKPVGLAVMPEGHEPYYVTGWDEMRAEWWKWVGDGYNLLFHHNAFDLSVGCHWFHTEWPHWERVHDTMFLLFLRDPYSKSLSLKPSADRYLDLPPEEQDELHNWIVSNIPGATRKNAGAYISRAPVELVGRYARGDVLRTRLLFDRLIGEVSREAYDRERRLSPKLSESSRRGIRVDRGNLEADFESCVASLSACEQSIFDRIGGDPFNVGSGQQLAAALERANLVTHWIMTPPSKTYPAGQRSTAKENLLQVCKDPELVKLLVYHSTMSTCVGTFMKPWLDMSAADGRLHTEWNQVANDEQGHGGTRTGRLSSARPNFQNPPNPFKWEIPAGFTDLPNMRSYLLPEEGHVWVKRDFSSQEIRILAHFEDGALMEAYIQDPFLDPHEMARQLIKTITNVLYVRKDVKITGFSIIYGAGVPGLASQLGRPRTEAFELREAYFKAMPGAKGLAKSTSNRGRSGGCITTWGGRVYYSETPKVIGGRIRTFEYKLLNYLIQGSAADQTKQVINDWWENYKDPDTVFMATIHDEVNASVPEEIWGEEMGQLRAAMDQDLFDVPMRSEGSYGPNWGTLKELTKEEDYGI